MERVLKQEEIDGMLRAAYARADDSAKAETRSIKPCTFRQSGQLAGDQLTAVTGLHEGFARNLTQSLGAYLRVAFEVSLVSVDQLSYREFLERIPEVTYMMSFQVEQTGAEAALQIDHSLMFPLVDILLGGTGACQVPTREISEIEERIMEEVALIICRELEVAWMPLGAKFQLARRQPASQMQHLLSPTEKTLCLSFEIKLAGATGKLALVFPRAISNTLLRKLSTDWSYDRARTADRTSGPLAAKLLDCLFDLQLGVTNIKLPIETVMRLAPQSMYNLGVPVRKPAAMILAGRETFEAAPVRHGRHKAAQILRQLAIPQEEREH